jgi:hypothetical protein
VPSSPTSSLSTTTTTFLQRSGTHSPSIGDPIPKPVSLRRSVRW